MLSTIDPIAEGRPPGWSASTWRWCFAWPAEGRQAGQPGRMVDAPGTHWRRWKLHRTIDTILDNARELIGLEELYVDRLSFKKAGQYPQGSNLSEESEMGRQVRYLEYLRNCASAF